MQSVLIFSKNLGASDKEVAAIIKENSIDPIDILIIENGKAVGIGEVREIQKKLFLKPLKGKIKAIVIKTGEGITNEAQNALLKTLEEAPEDTIIILVSQNPETILPTIVSRCRIVSLVDSKIELEVSEKDLKILTSGNFPEKLKLAQDLSKDKIEALNFLEGSIYSFRNKMLNNPDEKNLNTVKSLQKYYSIIKSTNVNLRLALENLFINL